MTLLKVFAQSDGRVLAEYDERNAPDTNVHDAAVVVLVPPEALRTERTQIGDGITIKARYLVNGWLALVQPPPKVTRRQGRLALLYAGLLEDVEAHIAGIADPVVKKATEIAYEAETWLRSDPVMAALAAALQVSPAQFDALWLDASNR